MSTPWQSSDNPYGQPSYGSDPTYGSPTYGSEPTYGTPSYGTPSYGGDFGYGTPGYGTPPTYGNQPSYGTQHGAIQPYGMPGMNQYREPKSKIAAALLFFFLGTLGVGNFYLGQNKLGYWKLGLSIGGWMTSWLLIGIPVILGVSIWAFIEFIFVLTGSNGYDRDAYGIPLE